MSVWWKNIEFYKEKSDCKAIAIAAWGLRPSLVGISRGQNPKIVLLFNVFKAIKRLTTALKIYIHGLRSYTIS